jgi:hypothetical protein
MVQKVSSQPQVPATEQREVKTHKHTLCDKLIKPEQIILLQISQNQINYHIKHQKKMLGTTDSIVEKCNIDIVHTDNTSLII